MSSGDIDMVTEYLRLMMFMCQQATVRGILSGVFAEVNIFVWRTLRGAIPCRAAQAD